MANEESKSVQIAMDKPHGASVRPVPTSEDSARQYGTLQNDTNVSWTCSLSTTDLSTFYHIWSQPPGTSVGLEAGYLIMVLTGANDHDFYGDGLYYYNYRFTMDANRTFSLSKGGYE